MRRIYVVGTSGSGKSTLAAALSEITGAPWIQLDALFHQPGWTTLPRPEFQALVAAKTATDQWIVDGNYDGALGDLVLDRADTVVSLELPRHLVMRHIIWRTARRIVTREELWSGNRERLRNFFSLNKEKSVIAWAWTTHGQPQLRVAAARSNPAYRDTQFVALHSRHDVDEFLASSAANPRWNSRYEEREQGALPWPR
jgi:adenylate kinase family enzyme